MDFNTNKRFFHRSFKMLYIGAPLFVIPGVIVLTKVFRRYLVLQNLFTAICVIGFVLLLFFFIANVKESELDRCVAEHTRTIHDDATKKITSLEHQPRFMYNYIAEHFVYVGEDISEMKKGRDGVFRSNIYSSSDIVLTTKRLYVYSMRFSILEDKEEIKFQQIELDSIDKIEITEAKSDIVNGGMTFIAPQYYFTIYSGDTVYKYETNNDSLADDMGKKIMNRKEKAV